MGNDRLRIGLLLQGTKIPKWQCHLVNTIASARYAEIAVVLLFDLAAEDAARSRSMARGGNNLILSFHLLLDKILFGRSADYDQSGDVTSLLTGIETVVIPAPGKRGETDVDAAATEQLAKYNLDVILQLTDKYAAGDLCSASRYGLLVCHPSPSLIGQALPPGYLEVINRMETMAVDLTLFSASAPAGQLVYHSTLLPDHLSVTKSQHKSYWRVSLAIPRLLEGIYHQGEAYLQQLLNRTAPGEPAESSKSHAGPTTREATRNMVKHVSYLFSRLWRKAFYSDHWSLLYKTEAADPFATSLEKYKFLAQPADRFWADPFVISQPDKHYIFVEELPYSTNKGHIAVIETDKAGAVLGYRKVLEQSYHLSYPFLFHHNSAYYMVPETGANRTVELYRCSEFPYKWEFVMNLMENILTADVTLFYHQGVWWMFCCVDGTGRDIGVLDELYLYYSRDLLTTDWTRHPLNPVVTDVSKARPAGSIFIKDNKIYRPSQDCAGMYGRAININQITVLTETAYEEHAVATIVPDKSKGITGTHTYNFSDSFTVVDGFRYRRK